MDMRSEKAVEYFRCGYSCSQSVLLVFADELSIDPNIAVRLASPFGGGMGRLREVCGAFSALLMAAGIKRGYSDPQDDAAKKAHYALVRSLSDDFKAANGSIVCREILSGIPDPDAREVGSPRSSEQQRRCEQCVASAVQIVSQRLFYGSTR